MLRVTKDARLATCFRGEALQCVIACVTSHQDAIDDEAAFDDLISDLMDVGRCGLLSVTEDDHYGAVNGSPAVFKHLQQILPDYHSS